MRGGGGWRIYTFPAIFGTSARMEITNRKILGGPKNTVESVEDPKGGRRSRRDGGRVGESKRDTSRPPEPEILCSIEPGWCANSDHPSKDGWGQTVLRAVHGTHSWHHLP